MKKLRCAHCGNLMLFARRGESPQQISARLRRTARLLRDEEQAQELAALVRVGNTTEQARQKMRIGVIRSQRIRAVAVRLGLLRRRHRGPAELARTERKTGPQENP